MPQQKAIEEGPLVCPNMAQPAPSDVAALREENRQLKELVVQLSHLVIKRAMDKD